MLSNEMMEETADAGNGQTDWHCADMCRKTTAGSGILHTDLSLHLDWFEFEGESRLVKTKANSELTIPVSHPHSHSCGSWAEVASYQHQQGCVWTEQPEQAAHLGEGTVLALRFGRSCAFTSLVPLGAMSKVVRPCEYAQYLLTAAVPSQLAGIACCRYAVLASLILTRHADSCTCILDLEPCNISEPLSERSFSIALLMMYTEASA